MVSKLKAHLFVCTNQKQKGECCAIKGGMQLRDELKDYIKKQKPEWASLVRVNASGCLGQCEHGIACVIYPQSEWLLGQDLSSKENILAALEKHLKQE